MALIERFEKEQPQRVKIQKPVSRATYSILTDERGNQFLYIRTFGSAEREVPGKPSQQVQLGPEAIEQLREILEAL